MTEQKFPLQWPSGVPRTPAHKVWYSKFDMSAGRARDEMISEIGRMGGKNIIISTNLRVRNDGGIYARDLAREPDDSGVAVYFNRKGSRVVFACDKYKLVWENMRAIGKTIEAMRGIERWGSAEMLDRAFTGFTALPAPNQERPWWEVLNVSREATRAEIQQAWKSKVKNKSEEQLKELNVARDRGFDHAAA